MRFLKRESPWWDADLPLGGSSAFFHFFGYTKPKWAAIFLQFYSFQPVSWPCKFVGPHVFVLLMLLLLLFAVLNCLVYFSPSLDISLAIQFPKSVCELPVSSSTQFHMQWLFSFTVTPLVLFLTNQWQLFWDPLSHVDSWSKHFIQLRSFPGLWCSKPL